MNESEKFVKANSEIAIFAKNFFDSLTFAFNNRIVSVVLQLSVVSEVLHRQHISIHGEVFAAHIQRLAYLFYSIPLVARVLQSQAASFIDVSVHLELKFLFCWILEVVSSINLDRNDDF